VATTQTRTRIIGVKTFGIPVSDQRRSLAFYVEKLGLEVRVDTMFGQERWIEVAPPGSITTIALVRGPDQVRVGIDTQVRLTTDNAEATRSELMARGVDVDEVVRRFPVSMFTVRDPDRNRILIVEESADR
jgi:catechol 2,3-dioxygenase-like lactoylglutathione lyase family enzyme